MAAWNVLILRDNDHLLLLSRELDQLGIRVAALSEVRRPKSGGVLDSGSENNGRVTVFSTAVQLVFLYGS